MMDDYGNVIAPRNAPALDKVTRITHEKARDICERAGYEVTGYTLTHRSRPQKCIIDMQAVRWLSVDDLLRIMQWNPPIERQKVPEGFEEPPVPVTAGDEAIAALAMALGVGYSSAVAHNTGWFVPNSQNAHIDARSAIVAAFAHVQAGGTLYRPGVSAATDEPPPNPKVIKAAREPDRAAEQIGLF